MNQEIESMLKGKRFSERNRAVAYSLACLLTGPIPYQCPEHDFNLPSYRGKALVKNMNL